MTLNRIVEAGNVKQKAYDRAKKEELRKATKTPKLHLKRPRAHIVSGGLPSLGKR